MPVLEKKLTGANLLIMKVTSVSSTAKSKRAAALAPSLKKWLTRETLIAWLREKKIFSIFFGTSLHPEVIKKSFVLLDFLYQEGDLSERELQKMWHIATKKHEQFRVSIMRALNFMAARMRPKELRFLFNKLQNLQLREHDKFSLVLVKAIAKALAPTQKESQKSQRDQQGGSTRLNRGLLDEFDKSRKPRGRAGSFDAQKPAAGGEKAKGGLLGDLDLPRQGKRRDSNDSTKAAAGALDIATPAKKPAARRQKSFSPEGRRAKTRMAGSSDLNFDFNMPAMQDQEDDDLKRALAASLADTGPGNQAPMDLMLPDAQTSVADKTLGATTQGPANRRSPDNRRPEDRFELSPDAIFNAPLDNQSKKTADGEFSPPASDEDGGAGGFKAGEIAAKALDLPISTSHSPKTADNMAPVAAQMGAKPANSPAGADDFNQDVAAEGARKATIDETLYNDETLGLQASDSEDAEKVELAREVLTFMWQLCLDDAVFGG